MTTQSVVVVDGRVFSTDAHDRGMGRYVRFLLQMLAQQGYKVCLILYQGARLKKNDPLTSLCSTIKEINVNPGFYSKNDAAYCSCVIEALIKELGAVVFFDTTPFLLPVRLPITGCPVIAVAYDLIPLKYPKEYLPGQKNSVMAQAYQNGLKNLIKANFIIAISNASKESISNYLGIEKDRIDVIFPCLDTKYFSTSSIVPKTLDYFAIVANHLSKHPKFALELYHKLNLSHPRSYLLCSPSKMQLNALKGEFSQLTKFLKLHCSLSEEEKILNQSQAKVVFHLSLDEGFGIPLLEAVFVHTKVICCDIGINREILSKAKEGVDKISLMISFDLQKNDLSKIEDFIDAPKLKDHDQYFQSIKDFFCLHWGVEAPEILKKGIEAAIVNLKAIMNLEAAVGSGKMMQSFEPEQIPIAEPFPMRECVLTVETCSDSHSKMSDEPMERKSRLTAFSKTIDYEDFYSQELASYFQDTQRNSINWETAMALYSFDKHELLREKKLFAVIGNDKSVLIESLAARGSVVVTSLNSATSFFDAVHYSGSTECSDGLEGTVKALIEIARALKPEGIVSISTRIKIDGPQIADERELFFTSELLEKFLIEPSGLTLLGELNHQPSFKTFQTRQRLSDFLSSSGDLEMNETLVLFHEGSLFCSVHLLLKKPLDWQPKELLFSLQRDLQNGASSRKIRRMKKSALSNILYRTELFLRKIPALRYYLIRLIGVFPGMVAYFRRKIKTY